MSQRPDDELIQQEIAVEMSLIEQYGTNQPDKTYEEGVVDALFWVLGGPRPQSNIEA
ncbi:hypothetical protein [Rheinheimera sp.]|uniref:hypothetical protein n=1 Tax=Rheinheimera sp. TaxID=1869214 RepID=UPI00307F34B1